MKVIKKYQPVLKDINTINDDKIVSFIISKRDYSSLKEYNTEEEAIEAAYKFNQWADWTIISIIRFDNF